MRATYRQCTKQRKLDLSSSSQSPERNRASQQQASGALDLERQKMVALLAVERQRRSSASVLYGVTYRATHGTQADEIIYEHSTWSCWIIQAPRECRLP